MKRIIVFVLAILLVAPISSTFANPSMAGNSSVIYVIPQKDDTLFLQIKYNGTFTTDQAIPIPTGATNLEAVSGAVIKEGKVFFDNSTTESTSVIFKCNVTGSSFNFTQIVANTSLMLLFPEKTGAISSPDVQLRAQSDKMPAQDMTFTFYLSDAIPEGKNTIQITFDRNGVFTPVEGTGTGTTGTVAEVKKESTEYHSPGHIRMWEESPFRSFDAHILSGVFVAILLAGVGFFIYFKIQNRKRKVEPRTQDEEEEFKDLVTRRRVTLDKITELQDKLNTGEIDEVTYLAKEQAYRDYLVKISLRLREFTD